MEFCGSLCFTGIFCNVKFNMDLDPTIILRLMLPCTVEINAMLRFLF